MSGWRSRFVAFGALVAMTMLIGAPLSADTVGPINFETYNPGTVRGQDSPPWTGQDCGGTIDQSVVNNPVTAPPSFGTKSFRMSNAVVSGCFDDAFSPRTTNAAGETTADPGTFPPGTLEPFFDASFTVASFTGKLQPGLKVQVSPDRGDGARMSYVGFEHVAGGIDFTFYDVQGVTPPAVAPCLGCANFVQTDLGTFDATVPHTVRITMQFNDGPSNDVVQVFIDGNLVHTGGSWEDYYTMDTESSPTPPMVSRTVDSLLFRATGTAQPALAGEGYLFDDVSVSTGPVVSAEPPVTAPATGASATSVTPRFTG